MKYGTSCKIPKDDELGRLRKVKNESRDILADLLSHGVIVALSVPYHHSLEENNINLQ